MTVTDSNTEYEAGRIETLRQQVDTLLEESETPLEDRLADMDFFHPVANPSSVENKFSINVTKTIEIVAKFLNFDWISCKFQFLSLGPNNVRTKLENRFRAVPAPGRLNKNKNLTNTFFIHFELPTSIFVSF